MRIGCLQFSPQVGDTENNLNRADAVLSRANPEDLDLLVLPELAFSGYNFKSLQDIMPFLEPSGSGITSLWARTMALKYNCTVTVGYPEKVDVSPKWPTGPEYYNSAIVVNQDGETIGNYRKSFLYYTDESWALEGNQGFYEGFIPGLGNTSIGICMDLNPYKFEAPWHAFEFAFHVLEVESNLVILSMAWMTREDRRRFTRMPNEPDMDTLTYWVTRLEPLIRSDNQDEIIVVFCNRTGWEDEATYAGTSAVIGIQDGEVKVYGLLGRGEKELLVVDTNQAPYAKLVYRPPEEGTAQESGELEKTHPSPRDKPKTGEGSSQGSKGNMTPKDTAPEGNQTASPGTKSVSDGGRSASTAVGTKSKSATSSPRLDSQAESSRSTPKKRSAAPIKVPGPSTKQGGSAMSPGSESFNIPTPSAPSPTPMAIRPKLIIPESPPIQPHQYPPDHPISAASLRSERSQQSFKSDESEASTQTIKSNPRPPEESTPYPDSGAPLSGYPENSYQAEKRIYGGSVTVSHLNPTFTPTTPFEDISPASPRYFWRPPDSLLHSPQSGRWTPGTPIGRKPEPFPWPEIKAASQQNNQAANDRTKLTSSVSNWRNDCQSPKSNASSNRTTKTARSGSTSGRSTSTTGQSKASSKDNMQFERPSSPKSRNASRSRLNERSHSALNEREVAAAVALHLESISHRAESANSMRKESAATTPVPDRVQSPQSRNASRNRPRETYEVKSDAQTIPIAASPSIFRTMTDTPEAKNFYRPVSRASQHQRSNSSASVNGQVNKLASSSAGSNVPRVASRAASRGRQPGPNGLPYSTQAERATSRDSTRNDRLHSRVSRRSSRSSNHQHVDLSQFERIESIPCPNCPVHGHRSESASASESEREPQSEQPSGDETTQDDVQKPQNDDLKTPIAEPKAKSNDTEDQPDTTMAQPQSASEATETSDYSSSAETVETAETIPSSRLSPRSPSLFDPPTPKAMSFDMEELAGLEKSASEDIHEVTGLTPVCCADNEVMKSTEIPTTVA